MMTASLSECVTCGAAHLTYAARKFVSVPGTGVLDCPHLDSVEPVELPVGRLVHLALSTLLRSGSLDGEPREMAHRIQDRLRVPETLQTTTGIPYVLIDGYGVSETGLAVARILAAAVGTTAQPMDAFFWQAAARIMRRRLTDPESQGRVG